ncbi:MAG: copper resistance CopC/CopD family protein, partial [Acidimicrobiales bacterium]
MLALVSSAGPAAAHAELIDASPSPGTGLAQAPAEVVIRFSERINLELSELEVRDDDGTDQGIGATRRVEGDRTAMRRQVGLLLPGRYTVRWRSASPYDGHALSGSYAFGVGTAVDGDEHVDTGPLASEGWLGLIGRLGVLAGLALWAGAAAGTKSARRAGVAAARVDRLRAVAVLAAVVGSVATGVSSVLGGGGDPSDLGAAFLTSQSGRFRLAVAVLAGVALLLRGRRPRIDTVLVAGAVIAEAASGHAASAPVPLLATLAFAAHLAAVGVWLYAIAVSVLNAGRIRDALRAFARPAVCAAVVVALTGTASAAIELTRPGDLVTTSYGRVILAKSALFALMALLGLTHRRARTRDLRASGRVRRPVLAELAAGGAAIALATLLVSFPNPPREAEAAERVATADTALLSVRDAPAVTVAAADGPFVVGVAVSPPSPGRVTVRLFVTGVEPGDGLREALVVATTAAGDRREAPLTSCGVGCFEGSASLDRAATWRVSTSLQSNRGAIATEVEIPLPSADGSELLARTLNTMERLSSARLVENAAR